MSEPKLLSGDVELTLKVNGEDRTCTVEPRSTLLDTLRNRLDVTGPKRVCDRASCGACTAIVDGDAVYSCTVLAVSCKGKTIETTESFDAGEKGVPHAFHQNDALMCGYCTPGLRHRVQGPPRSQPQPDARRRQARAQRQHLPVRHLHRCVRSGARRGQSHERSLTHGRLARKPPPHRHPNPPPRRPRQGLGQGRSTPATSAPRGRSSGSCSTAPTRTPRSGRSTSRRPRRCPASRPCWRSPRRGRPSATRATTWPPWPPRPRSRPATPPGRSRSTTRSCRTPSPRRRRWPKAPPRSSRGATSARDAPPPRASPMRRWPAPPRPSRRPTPSRSSPTSASSRTA